MLRVLTTALLILMIGHAYAKDVSIDGCAELSRVVYDEVQSKLLRGPGRSGPWNINLGVGEIRICPTAAETVSRAFTLAAQSAGLEVRWARFPHTSYFCQSGYLSQCHPQDQRISPVWRSVSQAVMGEMYNPISSNEVRFRPDDLRLRIGLSLRTVRFDHHRVLP